MMPKSCAPGTTPATSAAGVVSSVPTAVNQNTISPAPMPSDMRRIVTRASAAIVTNVAADHLGQYGIMTVQELAQVKLSVRRSLAPGGLLVLNADDAEVVNAAAGVQGRIGWFSLDPASPRIVSK